MPPAITDDDNAANEDPNHEERRPLFPPLATSGPTGSTRKLVHWAASSRLTRSAGLEAGPAHALQVVPHRPGEFDPWDADSIDRSDRYARSTLEIPITWLDLTPPTGSLHLKVMETGDAHRAEVWSCAMSPDEQLDWARSQGGWNIRVVHHARSFLVAFTVEALPAGLTWLAQLSSYQHLDLHPDGTVHVHLSGLGQDLQEVHRRLRRATDVEVVRVVDAEEEVMPVRGPRLTAAQRAAIEAAYVAGYFKVPPETSLENLAEDLGRSPMELSVLLGRGVEGLVEHLLGQGAHPASGGRTKLLAPPKIGLTGESSPTGRA